MDKTKNNVEDPIEYNYLIKILSNNAPINFRERLLKTIHEDACFKKYLEEDQVSLPEVYKSLLDNFNGFIVICDYTTGMYEYISEGIHANLGYDLRGYSKEDLTKFLYTLIYDKHDKLMMNLMLPTTIEYLRINSNPLTGKDYRYTCCVKVKNIYNNYFWYLLDTVILEVDEAGFPLQTLITCTNINQFKKDDCVYFNIMKKNEDGIYEVMFEGNENDNKENEFRLTKRELQIINLIGQGNTNKQIADKLSISLNTVQTHRKNLTKKTKCSGTAELVNFAFSRGIL